MVQFEVKSDDADAILRKLSRERRADAPDGDGESRHHQRDLRQARVQSADRLVGVAPAARGEQSQPGQRRCRSVVSALLQTLRKNKAESSSRGSRIEGKGQHNAYVDFEIPRAGLDDTEKAIAAAGETVQPQRERRAGCGERHGFESAVQAGRSRLRLRCRRVRPMRWRWKQATWTPPLQNVPKSATAGAGGRVIDANFSKDQHGQTARLIVEVPFSAANQLIDQAKHTGTVRGSQQSTNQQAPSGEILRKRASSSR